MEADTTKLLLVTANVGSIFEDPDHMLKIWLKEFLAAVLDMEPGMVAIHCQEVGGKNYEASMQHVNQFVKAMLGSDELQKYDRARVFLDEDYTAADKFTALGNLYFIHECVEEVMIYDFIECRFLPVEGREVLSGNIENIQIKEKAKYPQNFFPDFKWSRKGFLRTRWNVNNCVFDLINIHLFHDASNIIAMQKSPSVYSENRYRALAHTLQRFETDQFDKVPYFLFGDFNFRLDLQYLLQEITASTESSEVRGKKNQISKLTYCDASSNKVVLSLEPKYFDHHENHNDVFSNKNKVLTKYDKELEMYKDKLFEYDISFPPSYPFSEDVKDGMSYMKTRCPAWCDRILLSLPAKDIVQTDDKFKHKYNIIGSDVCMGDHKPVYLLLRLKKGKGNSPPAYDTQTSVERRKLLSHKISINGETVDIREDLNIHDYAEFEKSDELIPEFRLSIKSKEQRQLLRQKESLDSDGGLGSLEETNIFVTQKKSRSFQNIARQVCLMEYALKRWPRRNRERHHSSSSEDLVEDTESDLDTASVNTDVSDISGIEKIDLGLQMKSGSKKDLGGNGNTNINADNIKTDTSIRQRMTNTVNANTDHTKTDNTNRDTSIRQRTTNSAETLSSNLHDKTVVTHAHDLVQRKTTADSSGHGITANTKAAGSKSEGSKASGKTTAEEKEHKRGKLRCPFCSLL